MTMTVWALYDHPTEYPEGCEAREYEIRPGEYRPTRKGTAGGESEIAPPILVGVLRFAPERPARAMLILGCESTESAQSGSS